MIANAVQRGSTVFLYDGAGQDLPVSISTRGGRLIGFTASTVSIKIGTLIYTYDKWGNVVGTPISTASQGTVQSQGSQGNSHSNNISRNHAAADGIISDLIETASNYVYRNKWVDKNVFGKILTVILLPFVLIFSLISIVFTILMWLFIAAVAVFVVYATYNTYIIFFT